jgi:hypothetical protein
MKIKLTTNQLKMVLQTQKPKYPINFDLGKITKKEAHEIIKLLISKKKV